MTSLPEPLAVLVAELNRLPGIGPRSAERLALHLIQADTTVVRRLASVLVTSRDKILECLQCGGLAKHRVPDPGLDTDATGDGAASDEPGGTTEAVGSAQVATDKAANMTTD